MRCKTCHYSLTGLTGPPHRCPECGDAFDPNDPNTFETERSPLKLYFLHFIPLAMIAIAAAWLILPQIQTAHSVYEIGACSLCLFPVVLSVYGIVRWQYRRRQFQH